MQRSVEYIKFGFMACIGMAGMILIKNQRLSNMSTIVFIVAAFIMLVIYLTPEKYSHARTYKI